MRNLLVSATISTGILTAAGILMFCGTLQRGEAAAREDRRLTVTESPSPRRGVGSAAPRTTRAGGGPAPATASASPGAVEIPADAGPIEMVSISPGRVLARVNELEISLRDLIPIGNGRDGAPKAMSVEMSPRSLNDSAVTDSSRISSCGTPIEIRMARTRSASFDWARTSVPVVSEVSPAVQAHSSRTT